MNRLKLEHGCICGKPRRKLSLVAGNLKGYLTDAQIAEIVAKSNAQAQQAE